MTSEALRVLCLGGCNLQNPMRLAAQAGQIAYAGAPFYAYSMGEMLQALSAWRGELTIPADRLRLCALNPHTRPRPQTSPLDGLDAALVEPDTSIHIRMDGLYVDRRPIWRLLRPVRQLGPKAVRQLVRWYHRGLAELDETARLEAADALIRVIPPDWPQAESMIQVLRSAVPEAAAVESTLARLVGELAAPVGVVLFNWSYTLEGEARGLPPGFTEELAAAAARRGLPVFDPAPLIRQAGIDTALAADRRHYSEAFAATMAEPLARFALSIARG